MMVELFGPPGSGKTTFARALTAQLQEWGFAVEQKLSARPMERDARPSNGADVRCKHILIRRASRPLAEVSRMALHPLRNARDIMMAVNLMRVLPPSNVISRIKFSQYTSRLAHSWYRLACPTKIALFDQAFVQAICSLAQRAGINDASLIAKALDLVPRSDVVIRLNTPLTLVEARLNERRRRQTAIELLFESDLKTSLSSVSIIEHLHTILLSRGDVVLNASSVDQDSLKTSVHRVAERIALIFEAESERAASLQSQSVVR